MQPITQLIAKHDLIVAFLFVGIVMYVSFWFSKRILRGKIPGAAIAITAGLVIAYFGGKKGIADFPLFAGMAVLGGSMMRDFSIVSTAMGASMREIRKTGWVGIISLLLGISTSFFIGGLIGYFMGYHELKSIATIGAGACTFIVGPVTGNAIGASSDVIAISIAIGVIKSVMVTILTPIIAKRIGLDNPQTAMIYGGLIGTTSGVAAGLAATDPKLVPYGALTATFYTGLACLLCPSVLYFILNLLVGV
ncbi:MAG: malonate transporter subunit MadM [Bacteroidota bacterium]|jgi:malonate transporter MadM subunit|nr:malonate transporter subunit MadM [Chitinophagia bacterium]